MAAQAAPIVEGWLQKGEDRIPIEARYGSRYSLWIDAEFDGLDGEIDDLQLKQGDATLSLGRCRFLPDSEATSAHRRLVSLDQTHDFEKLLFKSKIESLESASLDLSLVLGYKAKIDTAFRAFVSDLTYDLNAYTSLLDKLDDEIAGEPTEVREIVRGKIIDSVGAKLWAYMDQQVANLESIVKDFSEQEHEHHGYYFRRQLWHIILRSPILARTNLKPRGYNGDSEMMRMLYLDDYQGDTTFGRIMHKYSVDRPAAQAVRNRRFEIATRIRRAIEASSERLRVLSVACGPAFEIRDVFDEGEACDRLHFSLLDQDQLALLEASTLIRELENVCDREISLDLIKESVRTMLMSRELKEKWGSFNFIYSMGLFDYLTPPVAKAVISKLYQLLRPGGELVVGNFAAGNPNRYFMEYWHDWKIIYRSREELLGLVPSLPEAQVSVVADETGIQLLLSIRKPDGDAS